MAQVLKTAGVVITLGGSKFLRSGSVWFNGANISVSTGIAFVRISTTPRSMSDEE